MPLNVFIQPDQSDPTDCFHPHSAVNRLQSFSLKWRQCITSTDRQTLSPALSVLHMYIDRRESKSNTARSPSVKTDGPTNITKVCTKGPLKLPQTANNTSEKSDRNFIQQHIWRRYFLFFKLEQWLLMSSKNKYAY